jgi:hypothetical protein
MVGGAGHAQREQRGRLDLDRQVGQHVGHHRPARQRRAEAAAGARVVQRERERLPHQAGRADREIEPGEVSVGEDLRTPRPSSPTRIASVPAYSTSLDAFDLLPALSLSRCTKNRL